ncbi:MAG: CPBP family intramembrane metalloprotease [Chloroflexi bacterium]|nr:CPBP family intramembrane metalloprotease [Chloroflexota bacterium]
MNDGGSTEPADRVGRSAGQGWAPGDGPTAAEAEGLPEGGEDGLPVPPSHPPGGRVFTVEGRAAPGLYFLAWLLSAAGIAVFFVGFLSVEPLISRVLLLGGLLLLGGGLASAAGYQVLSRVDRHPASYRGPSPLIVFGVVVVAALGSSLVLAALGLLGAGGEVRPPHLLLTVLIIGLGYVLAVQFLVVRTGALTWADMGWPGRGRGYSVMRGLNDVGYAVVMTIPATFAALLFAGLVGTILGVRAPEQFPAPQTSAEALAIAVAAAIIAPIGEELFFRGFALTAWQRDLGPRAALIRSSIFFALVHITNVAGDPADPWVGPRQALLAFAAILPLAFLLGWLFQRRGMVASITGHITYNTIVVLLLFLIMGLPAGG